MAPSDDDLIDALRDHAATMEGTSPENASFARDIASAERARIRAHAIESGTASAEEKAEVPNMIHPSVKTRYGL